MRHPSIEFNYTVTTTISRPQLRDALAHVRDLLLDHEINDGDRKLRMERICDTTNFCGNSCGTAACIGGWASLFLMGFEVAANVDQRCSAERLFMRLLELETTQRAKSRLRKLFYGFDNTADFDVPNVAATAIQRYLDGYAPWPSGEMPDVLPYRRRAPKKN